MITDSPVAAGRGPSLPEGFQDLAEIGMLLLPDLHIPTCLPWLSPVVDHINASQDVALVGLLGDLCRCYGTEGEYAQVARFLARLHKPYQVVNGNHDICFRVYEDEDPRYTKAWEHLTPEEVVERIRRFERFFRLDSRFRSCSHRLGNLLFLGLDGVGKTDQAIVHASGEAWLEARVRAADQRPLLVFAHMPVVAEQLRSIRYYEAGRTPFYTPPEQVRRLLRARSGLTVWCSGHLHLRPEHPFFEPYRTEDGVWQIHCPDLSGYSRADNQAWTPKGHEQRVATHLRLTREGVELSTLHIEGALIRHEPRCRLSSDAAAAPGAG